MELMETGRLKRWLHALVNVCRERPRVPSSRYKRMIAEEREGIIEGDGGAVGESSLSASASGRGGVVRPDPTPIPTLSSSVPVADPSGYRAQLAGFIEQTQSQSDVTLPPARLTLLRDIL